MRIDRTRQETTSGCFKGTPFCYRVDLAYHSFLAEDFIAISMYAPERTETKEASN